MGRPNNRAGYGVNRGSLSPFIFIGTSAPTSPQDHDLWLDINTSPGILKWYDSSSATWK